MRMRLITLAVAVMALAAVVGFGTTSTAAAQPATTELNVAITPAQSGGILNGVFRITNFTVSSAGQLVANGVFTGTARIGGVTQQITTTVSAILTGGGQQGSCKILDLTLGPLHLDLLGLVIDLNQVQLDITAQPGPGNLLGNLLCAVVGLLDNGGPLSGLLAILDRLNQLLG